MSLDSMSSGIYTVNIDPQMPEKDIRGYNKFVNSIAELPMASRYRAMASKPMACFEAVNVWQKLQGVLSEYKLGEQWFLFGQEVKDHYGFTESGQDMLKAQMPGSDNLLVADVAGYLFGFPYEKMLIAAGSLDYVTNQVSRHYSQRYPNLVVTARSGKGSERHQGT